jgi:hypothetical protein
MAHQLTVLFVVLLMSEQAACRTCADVEKELAGDSSEYRNCAFRLSFRSSVDIMHRRILISPIAHSDRLTALQPVDQALQPKAVAAPVLDWLRLTCGKRDAASCQFCRTQLC